MRLAVPIAAACLLLTGALACAPAKPATTAGGARAGSSEAPITPTAVSDDAFAGATLRLLRDPGSSPERSALLAGVVGRYLEHAKERFATRQSQRGLSSVTGAIFLVRAGEMRRELLAQSDDAIRSALAAVSQTGDEGRALALLTMRASIAAPGSPVRTEIDEHLAALSAWRRDTQTGGPLEVAGHAERAAVGRALLEPTTEALASARDAIVAWIDRAIVFNQEQHSPRPKREEAVEAFRAFRSGAETLAALYLRHGDVAGALAEIEHSSARRVVLPELYEPLERASSGDVQGYRDLLAWLTTPERGQSSGRPDPREDPEIATDPELLRAAAWGAAIEAYRHDPTAIDIDMALAGMLVEFGLPEVAPLVLADAVAAHPEPAALSAALGVVHDTMIHEDEADDPASARRVFRSAEAMVEAADSAKLRGRVQPSAARLRLVMGTLETRSGNLVAARPLLEAAAAAEPTTTAYDMLAKIDRQAGNYQAALDHLGRALATLEAKRDPAAAGEAHLATYEIQRDMGATEKAAPALAAALAAALDARQRGGDTAARANAERLLARVLDLYADHAGATRATERAFAASGRDRRQIASTVGDATARAFVQKDPAVGRTAVLRAIDADLKDEDLVYPALWLMLLEKERKVASDGTAARALASIRDDARWPGRLAAWGLGRIKDADLVAAARTPGQKTEATFYTAVSKRLAGDASAEPMLREVSKSATVDLVEVQLARDLLAGPQRPVPGALPANARIP